MSVHNEGEVCHGCEKKLETARAELQDWFRKFVKPKYPNAHISWAWRGQIDQDKFFLEGRTKLKFPKSPHNKVDHTGKPASNALDLFELTEHGSAKWDPMFFADLNHKTQEAKYPIRWGGTFKTLGDGDHFEWHPV